MATGTDERKGEMRELDKWVVASLTAISVALIIAAGISGSTAFLGYLGGTAFLAFIYFAFLRD